MTDVDWDDILAGGDDEGAAALAEPADDLADDHADARALALPAHGGGELAIPALAKAAPKARASRWSVWIPSPRLRTREQELLAAARLRDHKALKLHSDRRAREQRVVEEAMEKMRSLGMLRDGGRTKAALSISFIHDLGVIDQEFSSAVRSYGSVCFQCHPEKE